MPCSTIDVYKDDPVWDTVAKGDDFAGKRWFQLPTDILDRLYVTSYEVRGETVDVSDVRRHARELRALHPNCILIHI